MTSILVVEDEPLISGLLVDLLTEEGYDVQAVGDGASALLAVQADPPDLLILDIGLPVMTGDEVLRTLRSTGLIMLPIIVLTAGQNPHRFVAMGATAVLAKPHDLSHLLAVVQQYV